MIACASTTHTEGPWRWEYNAEHKTVHLVGGRRRFDLTVMDFRRWGMGGAVPRFRDTSVDGMNLMDRLCDKPEWLSIEHGRDHHKDWHMLVNHPDARLMEAAPALLAICERLISATDVTAYGSAIHDARAVIAYARCAGAAA